MTGFAISVTGLIWMLLIGALVGFLAGKIMKGSGFGALGNIVVGSILGGFVFGLLGIYSGSLIGSLIMSVIGACLLLWIVGMIKR
jgi:uncharacterized membrane protein YeaQ/YmgE (transglycosylase-associated protein family)